MSEQNTTDTTETISNVKEWYKATRPTEFQIDEIQPDLTFDWIIEHLTDRDRRNVYERLIGLDTMVKEVILHEALVRGMKGKKPKGQYEFTMWVSDVAQAQVYTWYGIETALEDADCTIGW